MTNEAQVQPPRWYNNSYVVGALLVLFFPAGLYLMWRHGMWSRTARFAVTGLVALIVVLAAVGDGGDPDDGAPVVATTEAAPSVTASPGEEAPPASPTTPPATETAVPSPAFDTTWVRAFIVTNEQFGGLAAVHFVAPAAVLADAVSVCVDHYLEEYAAAFCFGFGSDTDFEFAEVDRESGGMRRLCWKASEGQPLAGPDSRDGTSDNVFYEINGCPGGE